MEKLRIPTNKQISAKIKYQSCSELGRRGIVQKGNKTVIMMFGLQTSWMGEYLISMDRLDWRVLVNEHNELSNVVVSFQLGVGFLDGVRR